MFAGSEDLERRVAAVERTLHALVAELGERHPGILDRLAALGADVPGDREHRFVERLAAAEGLSFRRTRWWRAPPEAANADSRAAAHAPHLAEITVLFRATPHAGVWRVTRDGAFFGDYLQPQVALAAAMSEARDLRDAGRKAEVLFDDLQNLTDDMAADIRDNRIAPDPSGPTP